MCDNSGYSIHTVVQFSCVRRYTFELTLDSARQGESTLQAIYLPELETNHRDLVQWVLELEKASLGGEGGQLQRLSVLLDLLTEYGGRLHCLESESCPCVALQLELQYFRS